MYARYDGTLGDSHLIFIYANDGGTYMLSKKGGFELVHSERFYNKNYQCFSRREAIQLLKKYYKVDSGKQIYPDTRRDSYMEYKIFGEKK